MRTCAWVLIGVLVAGQAATVEALPGNGGACPFGGFAGTGTVTQNASNYNNGWTDWSTSSAPWVAHGSLEYMFYRETWSTPRDLGTVMVADMGYSNQYFNTAGEIWVQMDQGGTLTWQHIESYNVQKRTLEFFGVNQKDVYGVEIRVTRGDGTDPDYYQVGSIAFFEKTFANVALGKACFYSSGAEQTGSVTNGSYNAQDPMFLGGAGLSEQYVGVEFDGLMFLDGLLINTCAAGSYAWSDFDVQYYTQEDGWVTWGRADAPASVGDLYWVDFGAGVLAEKIRLYGCDDGYDNADYHDGYEGPFGGNNPGKNKGIAEIWAFGTAVPEPATMTLLALGGLTLLRRRR